MSDHVHNPILLPVSESTGETSDLWHVLFDALVPSEGTSGTLQGELLRVHGNLMYECYQNGMSNYYLDCDDALGDANEEPSSYPNMVDFLIDTLLTCNLAPDDCAALVAAKLAIHEDRKNIQEMDDLEAKEENKSLSKKEAERLDHLRGVCPTETWEQLFDITERLVINYCIANPQLQDRVGRLLEKDENSIEPLLQRTAGRVAFETRDAPGWIGLQLTWSTGGIRVDGVDERSPAKGALVVGDVIERIDGTLTGTMDGQGAAIKLLSGPVGMPVWLRLARPGRACAELVVVVRAARPAGV